MRNQAADRHPYETPVGSFRTYEEAAEACERRDLDPCDCVKYINTRDPKYVAAHTEHFSARIF